MLLQTFLAKLSKLPVSFFLLLRNVSRGGGVSHEEREGGEVTHLAFRQRYIKHFYLSFLYLPGFLCVLGAGFARRVTCSRRFQE